MNQMQDKDAVLVARAKRGERDAFRQLVEHHSRNVFNLAFRLTGTEEDAEDVVQETFLRAFRQLHKFQEKAQFSTWLYRIAANGAYDLLKKRNLRNQRETATEFETLERHTGDAAQPHTPDRLLFGTEIRGVLKDALGGLSAMERTAFLLRHFEGLSIREIGDTLGSDTSATKHSIFRAVKKLRLRLQDLAVNTK